MKNLMCNLNENEIDYFQLVIEDTQVRGRKRVGFHLKSTLFRRGNYVKFILYRTVKE